MDIEGIISGEFGDSERRVERVESLEEVQQRRWITAVLQGDLGAFERLVKQHEGVIFSLCLRLLGCRDDAAEACQDVFVRAYRALGSFRGEAKVGTWLCQIAVNRCRDLGKRRAARPRAGGGDVAEIAGGICPGSQAVWSDDLGRLERGLRALSAKDREILLLSCVENLSHRDCAFVLKCSERAVEGRLYRARKALAEWWER